MINSHIKTVDPAVEHYLAEHARIQQQFSGHEIPWLQALRQTALTQFAQQGFPTIQHEDWKYTNLAALIQNNYKKAATANHSNPTAITSLFKHDFACERLVFINGFFSAEFSQLSTLAPGIQITHLAQTLQQQPALLKPYLAQLAEQQTSAFTHLNTAFLHDGAYIHLPSNTTLSQPLHLLFLTIPEQEAIFNPSRNLIIFGENSHATIIEEHQMLYPAVPAAQPTACFNNSITELILGKHASCTHYKILQEATKTHHVSTLHVQQHAHSHFDSYSFALAGGFVRSDTHVILADEHTECSLTGLYLARDQQHIDHHTTIDHAKPHGKSYQNYKGVLADRSRVVFNGKVIVRPGSHKSNAAQSNKNLLLSTNAEIDTKPQLEIFNDDVQCTHGAAIGQLSTDSLFYLQSRGIDTTTARSILITAFVHEILQRIPLASLRQALEEYINHVNWMPKT